MTQIKVDAATVAQLSGIADREVELCDAEGNVIGWYAPARRQPTMQELIDSCPYSEEELQRSVEEHQQRVKNGEKTGRTWAEIRKDLKAL